MMFIIFSLIIFLFINITVLSQGVKGTLCNFIVLFIFEPC